MPDHDLIGLKDMIETVKKFTKGMQCCWSLLMIDFSISSDPNRLKLYSQVHPWALTWLWSVRDDGRVYYFLWTHIETVSSQKECLLCSSSCNAEWIWYDDIQIVSLEISWAVSVGEGDATKTLSTDWHVASIRGIVAGPHFFLKMTGKTVIVVISNR